jgi:hypothetical protein
VIGVEVGSSSLFFISLFCICELKLKQLFGLSMSGSTRAPRVAINLK